MNLRKYLIITCTLVSLFLFMMGAAVLNYMNCDGIAGSDSNLLFGILNPFKGFRSPVNILVLGGDKVNKNTDTMMLVNFDPATAKLSVLSIPRDTRVRIQGLGTQKINAAYPYGGLKKAVETASELLDVKIKYAVYIDTSSFREIINILGGVDFEVPADMDYDDPLQNLHIHLKKGKQHLNGAQAEQFMRFRQPSHNTKEIRQYYNGSDLKRIDAQQNFIKEVIKQKLNIVYLTKMNTIIEVIFKGVETNMKLDDILKLASNLNGMDISKVQMFMLPGAAEDGGAWYYIKDTGKTDEIVNSHFKASGTYVDAPNSSNKALGSTNNHSGSSTGTSRQTLQSGSKQPAVQPKDMKNDNPSNGGSQLVGTEQPIP